MLFVPNFIWTKNKPQDYEEYVHKENKVLLAEQGSPEYLNSFDSIYCRMTKQQMISMNWKM